MNGSLVIGLAVAGMLGTLARYFLAGFFRQRWPEFPWGTLTVNLLGCFLFGLIFSLADERQLLSLEARVILLIGFLGAFTTFSSYAFENTELLLGGRYTALAVSLLTQNLFGIVLVFAGMALGRKI